MRLDKDFFIGYICLDIILDIVFFVRILNISVNLSTNLTWTKNKFRLILWN